LLRAPGNLGYGPGRRCRREAGGITRGKRRMIKVSVLYPSGEGTKFDIDYYCTSHMPMVQQKLGAACKSVAVDHGLAGGAPGAPPPYVAIGHLFFDSLEAFHAAFAPHAQAIMGDIANYTNAQPVLQFSEVKL
jgi:uncharacterized protein (TIGR02118 family)